MNIKKIVILSTVLSIIILLIVSGTMSNAEETSTMIEKNGIKYQVPERYLFENKFPWIDKATGLDSDKNSFLIKIPANAIMKLFPKKIPKENFQQGSLIVMIYLLSSSEKQVMNDNARDIIDEIIKKKSFFNKAYEELDTATGWYRIYQSHRLNSRWYVFLNNPYSSDYVENVNDLVALCQKDEHIGTQCGIFAKTFNDVAIEMSLKHELLPYYKDVQNYVIGLLNSWRTSE